MRNQIVLARLVTGFLALFALSGCVSERHFVADSVWPFGNPNAPKIDSETAARALGRDADVTPIVPQAGNVWPGPVQPVPTLADEQANMNEPLGKAYTPSLPSPYPPGTAPPADADLGLGPLSGPSGSPALSPNGLMAPGAGSFGGQSGMVSSPGAAGGAGSAGGAAP